MDLAEREKVCKFTKSFSTDDNTAFYYNSRNSPDLCVASGFAGQGIAPARVYILHGEEGYFTDEPGKDV